MAFKLNLTEAEIKQAQGGNFEPLPEGTYGAIIYEVVEKQSKAGNDMYEITFKITDGPEGIGRQVKGWFVVTGKALFSVVGLLKALGLPYPNKDTPPGEYVFPDGDDFLGENVNLVISLEGYESLDESGNQVTRYRNNVKRVLAYDPDEVSLPEDNDNTGAGNFL